MRRRSTVARYRPIAAPGKIAGYSEATANPAARPASRSRRGDAGPPAPHNAIAIKPIVPACANNDVAYGHVMEPRKRPKVASTEVKVSKRVRSKAKKATPPSAVNRPAEAAVAIHADTRPAAGESGSTPSIFWTATASANDGNANKTIAGAFSL
jgi:hypothetical protein